MAELTAALARLVESARGARAHAYAPYSGFRVGAALETASGHVFTGVNVENASYGATVCAERSAVFTMIGAGERDIARIAVYTEGPELAMPCGMCRQVLFEHGPNAEVVVAGLHETRTTTLRALLPEPFVFEAPR